ncbi:MAG: hypothetical protein WCZ69_01375 [Candidatus Paceibacterota bacterium]
MTLNKSVLTIQKPLLLIGLLLGMSLFVALFWPGEVLADGGYYYGQPYYGEYDYGYDYGRDYGYYQPYHDGGYRKPLSPVGWPVATYRSRASGYYDYYDSYDYYGYGNCGYGSCGRSSYCDYYDYYDYYQPYNYGNYGSCSGGRCSPVNVNVYCGGGKCSNPGYYYGGRWGKG